MVLSNVVSVNRGGISVGSLIIVIETVALAAWPRPSRTCTINCKKCQDHNKFMINYF